MKNSMKVMAALVLGLLISGCSKSGVSVEINPAKRVAKYAVAVYKTVENPQKEDWVATLSKSEKVTVLKDPNLKPDMAYVQIAGGKKGYLPLKHLAYDAVVLVKDSALLQRPISTSGKAYRAEACVPGQILFVEDRTNENNQTWIKVSGMNQKNYFEGWLQVDNDNIQKSGSIILAALQWEQLLPQLSAPELSEEQKKSLETLKSAPAPFAEWANQAISKYEPVETVPVENHQPASANAEDGDI